MKYLSILLGVLWLGILELACNQPPAESRTSAATADSSADSTSSFPPGSLADLDTLGNQPVSVHENTSPETSAAPDTSELEYKLIRAGLVNIRTLDPEIQVDLKYASDDNFLSKNVYGTLRNCYMQPEVAAMLQEAHAHLMENHPNLRFIIFDGVRPRSVQFMMWDIVKGTDQQEYVAPPKAGSMHNYGASIDLSLATGSGELLDMGTPFDFFGNLAQPRFEDKYLNSGELTQEQVDNRRILRTSMKKAGFHGILNEWWHFNAFPREVIKKKYQPVE